MSDHVLAKIKEIIKDFKHPKTKETIFNNMEKIDIKINGGQLNITLYASKAESILYSSILAQHKEMFYSVATIDSVEIKVESEKPPKYKFSNIKNIIVVASGKGGVGKSMIATNLAAKLAKKFKTGLLDADIYGPSVTRLLGTVQKPEVNENNHFIPLEAHNIKFMSSECFVPNKNSSFIWRGPMLVKMLYSMICNTVWGELDYLIIDTPPGTGDIHLSLCENFVLSGVILCTMPQMLSIDDVRKAGNMFVQMHVKILGIIENMGYFEENDGTITHIFGDSNVKSLVGQFSVPNLATIPMLPEVAILSDSGVPAALKNQKISEIFESIIQLLHAQMV